MLEEHNEASSHSGFWDPAAWNATVFNKSGSWVMLLPGPTILFFFALFDLGAGLAFPISFTFLVDFDAVLVDGLDDDDFDDEDFDDDDPFLLVLLMER